MTVDKWPEPAPPRVDDADRARFLELMFWETAERMKQAISVENPSASTLQAVRMWFRDQGINLKTIRTLRPGNPLGALSRALPTFADDDDDGNEGGDQGGGQSPALRSIPPFAPTSPTSDDDF